MRRVRSVVGGFLNVRVITSVFYRGGFCQLRHSSYTLTIPHTTDLRSSESYTHSITISRLSHLPPRAKQHSLLHTHTHTNRYPHPSKNIRHTTQNSKMPKSTPTHPPQPSKLGTTETNNHPSSLPTPLPFEKQPTSTIRSTPTHEFNPRAQSRRRADD